MTSPRLLAALSLAFALSPAAFAEPAFTITSLSPDTAVIGGPSFILTVTGSNMSDCPSGPCSFVNWSAPASNTISFPATINSAGTQATATISSKLLNSVETVNISVTASTGSSNTLPFTVTQPVLTSVPSSLTFVYQIGLNPPGSQQLTITSNGAQQGLGISTIVNTPGGGTWLSTTTAQAATPATFGVSVNPLGLAPGTYTGDVIIGCGSASNCPLSIPVTFVINPQPALSVAPASLSFTYQIGSSAPASQLLALSTNAAQVSFTATASVQSPSNGTWLSVSPGSGTTPANLTVSVNPASVPAGTYSGTIVINGTGASNNPVSVPVTFTVNPQPTVVVKPSSLSFSYQIGFPQPLPQVVAVVSNNAPVNFTVAAQVQTPVGGEWLNVNLASGTTPANLSVSVLPTGLAAGSYSGSIVISAPTATNSSITIPVAFTVVAQPVLSAQPASLSFAYQIGSTSPAAQPLVISSSNTQLNFTAAASVQTPAGAAWLSVTPNNSTTPGTLSVSVNPTTLPPGTYTGTIVITCGVAANSPLSIPVTFTVTAQPALTATPASLSFTFQIGSAPPSSQPLVIGTTGAAVNFGAVASVQTPASGTWLAVTPPSGSTPGNLTVSVNPAGLAAGTYTGTITVTCQAASNSPLKVPVTFTVVAQPTLSVNPAALSFTYRIGSTTPPSQALAVTSSAGGSNFTVAATVQTPAGGAWLSASLSSQFSAGNVAVSVNPTGLPVGTYSGTVTITGNASNSPLAVPVTFSVTPQPVLQITPASLAFSYQIGSNSPQAQPLTIASTNAAVNFGAVAVLQTPSGGTWLSVSPASGNTPQTISVAVNPGGLKAGVYTGSIIITAQGASNSPSTIAVTFTVSAQPALYSAPASLAFSYQIGATVPSARALNIASSSAALNFTAAAAVQTPNGGTWLSLTPASGTTPAGLRVSVNPVGLAAGTYTGSVIVTASEASNNPLTVQVTLTVSSAPVLNATPASLAFSYQIGASLPAAQTLALTSSGAPLSFSAATAVQTPSGGAWLSVNPAAGTTPASLSVSVNPAGLPAGTYNATITLAAAGTSNFPLTVAVTFTVTAPQALSALPNAFIFTYQTGAANPAAQSLALTSGGVALSFTASAAVQTPANSNWLLVSPGTGTTPTSLSVSVNPAGLPDGTYTGTVTINTVPPSTALTVPVTLTVTTPSTLSATPAALSFTVQADTASRPAGQQIALAASAGALSFSAAAAVQTPAGGTWLSVTPATGTTPGNLTVSVVPGSLATGIYNGSITISAPGATATTLTVPVTLTVIPAIQLTPSITQITATTSQPTVTVTLNTPSPNDLTATLEISFTGNAAGLPDNYIDPGLQFGQGGLTATLTIPAGSTSASLPAGDAISIGSVAGNITVTLTSLTETVNGQEQSLALPAPNPNATITIPPLAPVITSVRIINVASSGFVVDIVASSTSRDLQGASFTFTPATGATLNGTTFSYSGSGNALSSQALIWFGATGPGLASGGAFEMQVPFTFQGSTSAIGSVSVTLTNSVGASTAVTGTM